MALSKQQYSPLAISTTSPVIKPTPKVLILHLFEPEIIKTDVANFRCLVQRLTGKPSNSANNDGRKERRCETKNEELPAVANGYERIGMLSTSEQQQGDEGAGTSWGESSNCLSNELEEIEEFIQELRDLL